VSRGGKLYPPFVHKASIKVKTSEVPKWYAQQVLKECPDIERAMVSTTRKLGKCDAGRDLKGFSDEFNKHLQEAVDRQEAMGSKAYYRKINSGNPGSKRMRNTTTKGIDDLSI